MNGKYKLPDCFMPVLRDFRWAFLVTAGQRLGFVRRAADEIERVAQEGLFRDDLDARYHVYAGITAVRAVIDAAALWLREWVEFQTGDDLPELAPSLISLTNPSFLNPLLERTAKVDGRLEQYIGVLRRLALEVDEFRQLESHRQGVRIAFFDSETTLPRPESVELRQARKSFAGEVVKTHPTGFYLVPDEPKEHPKRNASSLQRAKARMAARTKWVKQSTNLVDELREWARQLEDALCGLADAYLRDLVQARSATS